MTQTEKHLLNYMIAIAWGQEEYALDDLTKAVSALPTEALERLVIEERRARHAGVGKGWGE